MLIWRTLKAATRRRIAGPALLCALAWTVAFSAFPKQPVSRPSEGERLFRAAIEAETGNAESPRDSLLATELLRKAAEKGFAPAQNYLGFRYYNGEGVKTDIDSALYWLAKAAGNGDPKAANNLGWLLSNSDRVGRDYPQAVYWLKKASEAGVATGESLLGDLYRQGLGAPKDTVAAERLYTNAIRHGLRDAEKKLLAMKGWDWEKLDADSAVVLGLEHYTHGAATAGVTLFENAAAKGSVKAAALLGDALSKGLGIPYNHEESVRMYLKAAMGGDPSAQFVIAELLDFFPDALDNIRATDPIPGLTEEMKTASYWYAKAAEQGVNDGREAAARLLSHH